MLAAEDIARFRSDGVLMVENAIEADILAEIRAEYAAILARLMANAGLPATRDFETDLIALHRSGFDWFQSFDISLPGDRITDETPFHIGPAVLRLMTSPRLLDIVEALIGPEITSTPIQHVRIKPPAADLARDEARAHVGGTDWHQDRGVALEEADQTDMITVWVAITDATEANGCLTTLPRASSMLPHCPRRQTTIADGFIAPEDAQPHPVPAGGILLLDPLTPHAALPNTSDGIRWSFDLRFQVTGQPTGRAHFPDFVARSRANPDTELTDWRTLHARWTATRARLAARPHIDQHRWSADAPACA